LNKKRPAPIEEKGGKQIGNSNLNQKGTGNRSQKKKLGSGGEGAPGGGEPLLEGSKRGGIRGSGEGTGRIVPVAQKNQKRTPAFITRGARPIRMAKKGGGKKRMKVSPRGGEVGMPKNICESFQKFLHPSRKRLATSNYGGGDEVLGGNVRGRGRLCGMGGGECRLLQRREKR